MENFYEIDNDDPLTNVLKELQSAEPIKKQEIVKQDRQPAQLDENDLEKFIVDNSTRSVENTQAIIDILLRQIESTPDAELIESVAEMINSNNKALETLNKIHLHKEKFKQTIQLETLKAQAKLGNNEEKATGIPMTREALFKIMYGDNIQPKNITKN